MSKPSLSKLLTDCGNWFQTLEKLGGEWRATAMDSTLVGIGETPEQAMEELSTKLFLKKHKVEITKD